MPTTNTCLTLEVAKSHPDQSRVASAPLPAALASGEVLLKVENFAFTANNVTYAMFGDAMHYWQFFPSSDAAWGVIPVWGFATVLSSEANGIAVGERFYGYLPTAMHVVVKPDRVSPGGFVDGVAHRVGLPAVYNQYVRCSADTGYRESLEAQQALLRPLFFTSFLIDDFLYDNAWFGAERIVLSSASSKTAYGTAFCLHARKAVDVVGLTSKSNLDFTRSLGCYTEVFTYDEVADIGNLVPTVYVDFSGNTDLRHALHTHFGDALKHSASIGGTDWQHLGKVGDLPGPRPTLFFAPSQIQKRIKDWGNATLMQRLAAAWTDFMVPVTRPDQPWLAVNSVRGVEASQAAMQRVVAGKVKPDEGMMLSLWG